MAIVYKFRVVDESARSHIAVGTVRKVVTLNLLPEGNKTRVVPSIVDLHLSHVTKRFSLYLPADFTFFMVAVVLVPKVIAGVNIPIPGNHG
jgi:hypothetical protein